MAFNLIYYVILIRIFLGAICCEEINKTIDIKQGTELSHPVLTVNNDHRSEVRLSDGTVQGSYSHVVADGIRRKTEYRVGPNGHEVTGVNDPLIIALYRGLSEHKTTTDRSNLIGIMGSRILTNVTFNIPTVEELIQYTYRHNGFVQPETPTSTSSINDTGTGIN